MYVLIKFSDNDYYIIDMKEKNTPITNKNCWLRKSISFHEKEENQIRHIV